MDLQSKQQDWSLATGPVKTSIVCEDKIGWDASLTEKKPLRSEKLRHVQLLLELGS